MIEYVSATEEGITSDSSDSLSVRPPAMHHLLRHKLSLGISRDKTTSESKDGKLRHKQRAGNEALSCKHTFNQIHVSRGVSAFMFDCNLCVADSECDTDDSALEDQWMSEEMSQSEDETSGDGPKR